jgi:hypothetical protein
MTSLQRAQKLRDEQGCRLNECLCSVCVCVCVCLCTRVRSLCVCARVRSLMTHGAQTTPCALAEAGPPCIPQLTAPQIRPTPAVAGSCQFRGLRVAVSVFEALFGIAEHPACGRKGSGCPRYRSHVHHHPSRLRLRLRLHHYIYLNGHFSVSFEKSLQPNLSKQKGKRL